MKYSSTKLTVLIYLLFGAQLFGDVEELKIMSSIEEMLLTNNCNDEYRKVDELKSLSEALKIPVDDLIPRIEGLVETKVQKEVLDENDFSLLHSACVLLGEVGKASSAKALLSSIKSQHNGLHVNSISSYLKVQGPSSIKTLGPLLKSDQTTYHEVVRLEFYSALESHLTKSSSQAANGFLKQSMKSESSLDCIIEIDAILARKDVAYSKGALRREMSKKHKRK